MCPILNFERFLYKNIGTRVKEYRKQLKLSQDEFSTKLQNTHYVHIDRYRLSYIENGKVYENKNPYLLTSEQIRAFSNEMNCSAKDFIFGNAKQRENDFKLYLLAIIMNSQKEKIDGTDNLFYPFLDFEFPKMNFNEVFNIFNNYCKVESDKKSWILRIEGERDEANEKILHRIEEWFKKTYPFFTCVENINNFRLLSEKTDKTLEKHSNLLIKLMASDYAFTSHLITRIRTMYHNIKYVPDMMPNQYIGLSTEDFKNNRGNFGRLAAGRKNNDLCYFIEAFNKMWKRNRQIFMKYFEGMLFNIDINTNGLKNVNNEFFHKIITSNQFTLLLYSIIETERYSIKLMDGRNQLEHGLQMLILEEKKDFLERKKSKTYQYLSQILNVK